MLRPVDRTRRDGPLVAGPPPTLAAFVPPDHLLRRLEAAFDFAALAAPLEQAYAPTRGRPAIHPEIVLRLMLLGLVYRVPSYRQLPQHLRENVAWRWFCHMTMDDAVPDHSTLSVFLDRVGAAALQAVLAHLNAGLCDAGLFSGHTYLDATLQPAPVRQQDLPPVAADERAEAGDGTWQGRRHRPGADGEPDRVEPVRSQDAAGRLPLPHHDRDARWRTQRDRTVLGYKHTVWTERGHFILAQDTAGADVVDIDAALPLLEQLPMQPRSVATDSGYRAGRFRTALRRRGIRSAIPVGEDQTGTRAAGFRDQHDHLRCPTGARLEPVGFPDAKGRVRYAAPVAACRVCPRRTACITTTGRYRKELWLSRYRLEVQRARRQNAGRWYERALRWRQTVAEGVFARLDQLTGARVRVRGLERVRCTNTVAAVAHNLLTALGKRRFWRRGAVVMGRPIGQRGEEVVGVAPCGGRVSCRGRLLSST